MAETVVEVTRQQAVSVHEAAHCVAALALGIPVVSASIRGGDASMGSVTLALVDIPAPVELEGRVVMALSARAAEEVILELYDPAASTSDVMVAYRDALRSIGVPPDSPEASDPAVEAEATEVLHGAWERARRIVTVNAGAIRRLAEALERRGWLDGTEIQAIIGREVER